MVQYLIHQFFYLYKDDCSFINLCKEEQLGILKILLRIQEFLHKCQRMLDNPVSLDDNQRYLEMAIRLDPKDNMYMYIFHRKENRIYLSQRSSKSFK